MKVLLSFTKTLDGVAAGTLTDDDLAGALFCFGCTPAWPFDDPKRIIERHARYQQQQIEPAHVLKVAEYLRKAAADGRAVWRRDTETDRDGFEVHNEISQVLEAAVHFRLNPNLPPITENGFLKTAIERVDRYRSVEVIA